MKTVSLNISVQHTKYKQTFKQNQKGITYGTHR